MLELHAVVHQKEMALGEKLECCFCHHQFFSLFLAGVIAPMMVLAAVALSTCIIAIPMCFIFGWL